VRYFIFAILFFVGCGEEKPNPLVSGVYIRDVTYRAGERESEAEARAEAERKLKRVVSEEAGSFISSYYKQKLGIENGKVSKSVENSLIAKSEHFMKLKILDHSWENGNYWLKAEVRVSKEKIDDILKKESSSKKENELLQNIVEQNKKITKLMTRLETKLAETEKALKEAQSEKGYSKREARAFLKYPRKYSRNSNGVVSDGYGLEWQDNTKSFKGNFDEAENYCQNLRLDGKTDWRLPSNKELWYLADRSRANPAISPTFRNVENKKYWTNQIAHYDGEQWQVNFEDGFGYSDSKSSNFNTRYVRGESFYENIDFQRKGNLIFDNTNGGSPKIIMI
jgi:hypothetical protein